MNSIESNFVPYQIALDMKSIGFDKPNYFLKWYDSKGNIREGLGLGEVKAPLYQQAFRWFREEHGICSWIERLYTENSVAYYKTNQEYKEDASSKMHNLIISLKEYNTYEKAELACLVKLIKRLKVKLHEK